MKISVAMCTFNGEKYLVQQLDSIFNQTTPVQEIIICDDLSVDHTIDIIKTFQQKYSGIINLIQNKQPLKARKNFEQAIVLCTGDIIFLCDQDDVWVTNKVEVTTGFFQKNNKAMGVFSNGYFLGDDGINQQKTIWGALSFSDALQLAANETNILEMLLKLNNFVTGAAFCFKKEVKEYILPLYCPVPHWHDYWIAIAIALRNGLYFLNEKLIYYRVHATQQTGFSLQRLDNDEATFKEGIWNNNHKHLSVNVALPFLANAIERCRVYKSHFIKLGNDVSRINILEDELKTSLEYFKKEQLLQLGFFEKKKLFVKTFLFRKKYGYYNSKDKLLLLLGNYSPNNK